jgi:hydrogenase-4 component B
MRSRLDTAAFPAFLASMAFVFGSANAFAFLFAWEVMALTSAVLVFGPRPDAGVARAGYTYLALTHLATAAIAVAFAILASSAGSLAFADFPAAAARLSGPVRDVVFVLLVVGFGTKAGIVPLHVWLPRAHPVAPSPVSAVMSGVMIKAGVFGIVLFGIDILGPGPAWWGVAILALGAVSAVLGVLYALAEHDLKRLLAYHSIENIGIILLGLGVAALGRSVENELLVLLGLGAALFHVLNHALFKGLLFLGAGAVQGAAGTRDLNRLGGLARAMPVTALAFGVGAAAISGLPPLNGFASEWLTFQALLSTGGQTSLDPLVRFAGYAAIGALALTAALAVACFVKATGMTFLARPRGPGAADATEAPGPMRAGMVALAIGCIVVGLVGTPVGAFIGRAAWSALAGSGSGIPLGGPPPLPALGDYTPLLVAALLSVGAAIASALLAYRSATVRRSPTWTCGIAPEASFEYTATSFSKPLRLFFRPVFRPNTALRVERHPGTPFPSRIEYESAVDHVIESRVYDPLHRVSVRLSQAARRFQQGTLQLYVAYVVVAVVVLLIVAR